MDMDMETGTTLELGRDCEAVQIPVGNTVVLPAGTQVEIAQILGGAFTVHALGGLFRIGSQDAEALGLDPSVAAPEPERPKASGPVDEKALWDVLRTCYDPEIPVNIVDLGLVYDLCVEPLPDAPDKSKVFVKMTLTAPGCGMGPAIASDAQQKLLAVSGVEEASVEVVWDPPWHHSMISPEGRRVLGLD
jgi:probable FeS assembly SUF system protein SufT